MDILYSISSFSFMDFSFCSLLRGQKNARWHLDFAAEACIIPMQAVEQTIPPKKKIKYDINYKKVKQEG